MAITRRELLKKLGILGAAAPVVAISEVSGGEQEVGWDADEVWPANVSRVTIMGRNYVVQDGQVYGMKKNGELVRVD